MSGKAILSLDEQKKIMLDLLKKLIQFLDDNGLKYTLAFGTLIGAVRHKGFIPWDDDVDIAMPYDDYKKMISLLRNKEISENVRFSCHETNPNHLWAFGKVYDTTTKLDEKIFLNRYAGRQESLNFGLYIDVFPIYPAPDGVKEQVEFEKEIRANYKRMIHASRKVVFPKGCVNAVKKMIYDFSFILSRLIGIDYFLRKHDRLISRYVKANTNTVCSNIVIKKFAFLDKSIYDDTVLVPFENLYARIPANYDVVLKNMYGDYMKLPPENQRRSHVRLVEYR